MVHSHSYADICEEKDCCCQKYQPDDGRLAEIFPE